MHRIFVYGSLRAGGFNSHLMDGAEFLGEMTIEGFRMYSLGAFPMIRRTGEPEHQVVGEVYLVSEGLRDRLDRLEGHPEWYRREEVAPGVEGYVYQHPAGSLVKSGDWRKR